MPWSPVVRLTPVRHTWPHRCPLQFLTPGAMPSFQGMRAPSRRRIAPLLLAGLLAALPSLAQVPVWRSLDGPFGGTYDNLVELPNGTLLASGGTLFVRSTDDGRTWTLANHFLNTELPTGTAANAVSRLMTTADGSVFLFGPGLFRSTDGENWTRVAEVSSPGYPGAVEEAVETAAGTFLAATAYSIYRSVDRGATWVQLPPTDGAGKLYVSGNTIWATGRLQNVLRRSTDDGLTWESLAHPFGNSDVFHVFPSGRLLKAEGGGLSTSDDGGLTWTLTYSSQVWHSLLALQDGRVMVGNGSGGALTSDGGTTFGPWRITMLPSLRPARVLHQTRTGAILSGNDGYGLVRSDDGGTTWQESGTPFSQVLSLHSLADGTLLAGTSAGIHRWNGTTWTWVNNLATWTYDFEETGGVILSASGPLVYRSTDAGLTWSRLNGTGAQGDLEQIIAASDGTWYKRKTNGAIYRSENQGGAWTRVTTPDGGNIGVNLLVAEPSGTVLAAGSDGLWRTADKGQTWTRIDNFPTLDPRFAPPARLAVQHLVRTDAGIMLAAVSRFLFRSTDNGVTWSFVELPISPRGIFLDSTGTLWIGGGIRRLLRSTDLGTTLEDFATGFPAPTDVEGFVEGPGGTIYMRSYTMGAWMLGTSGVANERPDLPTETAPVEAWPNPFDASAEIRFSAPAGAARVDVYDVLGRRLATPFDGTVSDGETSVSIDGTGLPAGPYFVRVTTATGVSTRTVVRAPR